MNDRLFISLVGFSALGLVGLSLVDLIEAPPQAVEATRVQQGLLISEDGLKQVASSDGFPATPAPGPRGDQTGTRLAAFDAFGPQAKRNNGARLLLGPRTAEVLTTRPFSVVLSARAVENNGAKETALGILGEGGAVWAKAPVTADFTAIRFDFPAQKTPPRALVFWAATEGKGAGIEVKSILLTAQTPAQPPQPRPVVPPPAAAETGPARAAAPAWTAPDK
jgi:hypothetical protein